MLCLERGPAWDDSWDTPAWGAPHLCVGPLGGGQVAGPLGGLQHDSQGCAWKGPEVTCTSHGGDPKHYPYGNPKWWVSLNFGIQWGGRGGDDTQRHSNLLPNSPTKSVHVFITCTIPTAPSSILRDMGNLRTPPGRKSASPPGTFHRLIPRVGCSSREAHRGTG